LTAKQAITMAIVAFTIARMPADGVTPRCVVTDAGIVETNTCNLKNDRFTMP
jgi:hypothetical protein